MNTIIEQIDREIGTLQHVRNLLSGEQQPTSHKAAKDDIHLVPRRKHKMSPEGRARIAKAAKARWKRVRAEQKQAAKAA